MVESRADMGRFRAPLSKNDADLGVIEKHAYLRQSGGAPRMLLRRVAANPFDEA
jgi:hypothetical protein